MGTNDVFENAKRQKIGHYNFLKYHFSQNDDRRIQLCNKRRKKELSLRCSKVIF